MKLLTALIRIFARLLLNLDRNIEQAAKEGDWFSVTVYLLLALFLILSLHAVKPL